MRKLSLFLFALMLVGMAGSALAAKEAKEVLHCGCVVDDPEGEDATNMRYQIISVSGNSQGHRNHLRDTESLCFSETDGLVLFARDLPDCMISGTNDGLFSCAEDDIPDLQQDEGDICGSEVPLL